MDRHGGKIVDPLVPVFFRKKVPFMKKKSLALVLFTAGLLTAGAAAEAAGNAVPVWPVDKVTGVTHVYGDGEKVAEAVLHYTSPLDPASVQAEDFAVDGRTIESVTVGREPASGSSARPGQYVILKFAQHNTVPMVLPSRNGEKDGKGKGAAEEPKVPTHSDRTAPDLSVAVRQVGEVKTARGQVLAPMDRIYRSSATEEPDLAGFTQHLYTDPETGWSIPYNLYLPEKYDPQKKYPLLFFCADMSANNNDLTTPLYQGMGAVIFASAEEQHKHPAIILAPQYTDKLVTQLGMLTDDTNTWTKGLTLVSHLLQHIADTYSVDPERIYGTGQSQGGMTNIAISDRYPDLFAAQYLVACQWNTEEMKVMKDKHLWITVCEGDTKAYPGMNAATALWESLGTRIARTAEPWNSTLSAAELDAKARALAAQGAPMNYTVFAGGSHMYTWTFAYQIPAIRDWLFAQRRAH